MKLFCHLRSVCLLSHENNDSVFILFVQAKQKTVNEDMSLLIVPKTT